MNIVAYVLMVMFARPMQLPDSLRPLNPGVEKGISDWYFWARSADSGKMLLDSNRVHTGSKSLRVLATGARDWAVWPASCNVVVQPGEIWEWSVWTNCDSGACSSQLGFSVQDTLDSTVAWNTGAASVPKSPGWNNVVSRIKIPKGWGSIQARISGVGKTNLGIDDAKLIRTVQDFPVDEKLTISNDSISLEVDPKDLSMILRDSISQNSTVIGGVTAFHCDSAYKVKDTIALQLQNITEKWLARLKIWVTGSDVNIRLDADSSQSVKKDFQFPGAFPTESGQWILIPRGTGLAFPVDSVLSNRWIFRKTPFWAWQVSQSLTGVTNGNTGYSIDVGQFGDSYLQINRGNQPFASPEIWQTPSKGVFGHARQVMIAPVRKSGFVEMAKRYKMHRVNQGKFATWSQKTAIVPNIKLLNGAIDFWIKSNTIRWKFFDTLRYQGLDKGLINWTSISPQDVDSLNARGWLIGSYRDWIDVFPSDTTPVGRQYSTGTLIDSMGKTVDGWLDTGMFGVRRQALVMCSAKHQGVADETMSQNLQKYHWGSVFVDVELAQEAKECWSPAHPIDRETDLRNRVASMAIMHDRFKLVAGSEQTRDIAQMSTDYGEGPMSIASVANAGNDWSTPEGPEQDMDEVSMNPFYRIPLLPLVSHDGFAPTWYSGDGQSKVLARWDDKDAWNVLYGTMPLIVPKDRKMWDSLKTRYLRTINVLGPLLQGCHFSEMTDFAILSEDRMLQMTLFASGWKSVVNFDSKSRDMDGVVLAPKGYRASGDNTTIERTVVDGTIRTKVISPDRYFLDPEGTKISTDGFEANGPFLLKKISDTLLFLSFMNDKTALSMDLANMFWPTTFMTVQPWDGFGVFSPVPTVAGRVTLSSGNGRMFYFLRGDFRQDRSHPLPGELRAFPKVDSNGNHWEISWEQNEESIVNIEIVSADGKRLLIEQKAGESGLNKLLIPMFGVPAWVKVYSNSFSYTKSLVRLK